MTDDATAQVLAATARYFDLMYDNDTARFEAVFADSARLHGLRDNDMRVLHAADYKQALASTASPKSKGAPREQEVLMLDFASATQAIAKVRVRIDTRLYVDYLCFHRVDGIWLITAKSFHVEQEYPPSAVPHA